MSTSFKNLSVEKRINDGAFSFESAFVLEDLCTQKGEQLMPILHQRSRLGISDPYKWLRT